MKKSLRFLFVALLAMMGFGNAMAEDVIWSEDFSSYAAKDVPTGGSFNYVCTGTTYDDSGAPKSGTMIYDANLAGGTSPELLVAKSGGSFQATVNLGSKSGDMILSFKCNKSLTVTVSGGTLGEKTGTGNDYVYPITGASGSLVITFTMEASANARLDDIKLFQGEAPEPQPEETKTVTIAEFNAAAESTNIWYQLTGIVKNLKDGDQYGNFDLEDETASVYVYGLLSEKGGEKKKFQELVAAKGIKNGDKLTIIGNRGSYNEKIEVVNAYFVSVESNGDTPEPQPEETKTVTIAEFNAAAESTNIWYQLTGIVKNLKDGDQYGNFDLEDETASVYVYGLLSEKGGAKKKFQELVEEKGIKEGSKITIIGNRGSYNEKIEVVNAYFVSIEASTEQSLCWDFTKWSEATIANLAADAAAGTNNWSNDEKNDGNTVEGCYWYQGSINEDGTISANGTVIEELKGLKFNSDYAAKRSLAIAVNYPSTSLGTYAGPAYLWLGGGGSKQAFPCFTIPGVKAGSSITFELESHKGTDARGIGLYKNTYDAANIIGEQFKPTTKDSKTWEIAEDCDVVVWNTSGCHIYKITIGDASASVVSVKAEEPVKGIFNLAGQRLEKAQKGLNIINGKKVMVK